MATETLRPNADTQVQCYGSDGDQYANYQLVDESSANDADYVQAHAYTVPSGASITLTDLYGLPDSAIPAGSVISNVTLYGRFRRSHTVGGSCEFAYKIGSTTYYSSVGSTTSNALYSLGLNTNPATGVAWTISDIDGLQIGCRLGAAYYAGDKSTPTYDYQSFCSQLYIVVTYTPAALSSFIPGIMQHNFIPSFLGGR